tara:strand:+ start:42 stop:548 length:507 start_codon:yes stop_codon:yes gene_type:complete
MAIEYGDGSDSNTGRIIQVKEAYLKTIVTLSSSSDTAISGLSEGITCHESTSQVKIDVFIGCCGANSANYYMFFQLYKDGNIIGGARGNTEGSRQRCTFSVRTPAGHIAVPVSFSYMDTVGDTNSHTYDVRCAMEGGVTGRINTTGNGNNQSNYPITISSLILTEVAV